MCRFSCIFMQQHPKAFRTWGSGSGLPSGRSVVKRPSDASQQKRFWKLVAFTLLLFIFIYLLLFKSLILWWKYPYGSSMLLQTAQIRVTGWQCPEMNTHFHKDQKRDAVWVLHPSLPLSSMSEVLLQHWLNYGKPERTKSKPYASKDMKCTTFMVVCTAHSRPRIRPLIT